MLDSGFMPPFHLRTSDRNVQGGGCDVATREKTVVFLSTDENYCTLRTILNAIVCCTQSNHFVAAT